MTPLKTTMLASLTLMLAAASAQADLEFNFTKIAQSGDPTPGFSSTFDSFGDPAVDDSGNVAFHANSGENTLPEVYEGTYGTKDGALIRFSDESTPFPGATFTLSDLDDHVEIRNGIVLSFGNTKASSIDDSLFTSDGTTGRLVAQEGVTVLPSAGNPVNTSILDAEGFGFDGTRIAFVGIFSGGDGVYLDDGTTLSKIADTSDTTPSSDTFTAFYDAMPDSNGDGIVFRGTTASSKGIYVSENDVLSKVADNLTDFAPSAVGNKVKFGEPDIDGGAVAFTVKETGSVSTEAVILADGNSFTTIADLTTMLPTGVMATSFRGEVAVANGSVAFNAETSSGESVFVWRNGALNTVLSVGDMLDGLTVTDILPYNRPFFADGYMALALELSDGSTAIYRISINAEQCYAIKTSAGKVTTFCL